MKIEFTSSPLDDRVVEEEPEEFPNQKIASSCMYYCLYKCWNVIRPYSDNRNLIDTELFVQNTLHVLKEKTDLSDSDINDLEPKIREILLPAALDEYFKGVKEESDKVLSNFNNLDLSKLSVFESSGDPYFDSRIISMLMGTQDFVSELHVNPFIISVFKNTETILAQIKSKGSGPYRISLTDFLICLRFSVKCSMRKHYNYDCYAYDQLVPKLGEYLLFMISKRLKMDIEVIHSESENSIVAAQ